MCEFCKQFKRDDVGIGEILGRQSVYLAAGSSKVPEDEQFVFCPKCGCRLRNDLDVIKPARERLMSLLNIPDDIDACANLEIPDKLIIQIDGEPFVLKISKPKFGCSDIISYTKDLIFED